MGNGEDGQRMTRLETDVLAARCTYQTSVTAVWRSPVSVQEGAALGSEAGPSRR